MASERWRREAAAMVGKEGWMDAGSRRGEDGSDDDGKGGDPEREREFYGDRLQAGAKG